MNFAANAKFTPVALGTVIAKFLPRIIAATTEGANAVVAEAQTIAPVDTGEFRDSIHVATVEVVGTTVQATVIADAPHSEFVEFGTGVRGEGTYPWDLPEGWTYDFRGQNWQGHAAQPTMRPALDTAQPEIIAAFAKQGFK